MSSENELTDYMGFQGLLDDEETLVRQTARKFVNKEVLPIIDDFAQKEEFPAHLVKFMGELGFLGPTLPQKYGCAELSNVGYGLLMYELERGDSALRSFASVQGCSCYVSHFFLRQRGAEGPLAASSRPREGDWLFWPD